MQQNHDECRLGSTQPQSGNKDDSQEAEQKRLVNRIGHDVYRAPFTPLEPVFSTEHRNCRYKRLDAVRMDDCRKKR